MKNPLAAMGSKVPPPPPEPTQELTPEQRRLDEAKSRLGKLSPELIEDVRLLCGEFIHELAMKNYADENGRPLGIPFEAVRRDLIARAPSCP